MDIRKRKSQVVGVGFVHYMVRSYFFQKKEKLFFLEKFAHAGHSLMLLLFFLEKLLLSFFENDCAHFFMLPVPFRFIRTRMPGVLSFLKTTRLVFLCKKLPGKVDKGLSSRSCKFFKKDKSQGLSKVCQKKESLSKKGLSRKGLSRFVNVRFFGSCKFLAKCRPLLFFEKLPTEQSSVKRNCNSSFLLIFFIFFSSTSSSFSFSFVHNPQDRIPRSTSCTKFFVINDGSWNWTKNYPMPLLHCFFYAFFKKGEVLGTWGAPREAKGAMDLYKGSGRPLMGYAF